MPLFFFHEKAMRIDIGVVAAVFGIGPGTLIEMPAFLGLALLKHLERPGDQGTFCRRQFGASFPGDHKEEITPCEKKSLPATG
jgi:hypothetical protein